MNVWLQYTAVYNISALRIINSHKFIEIYLISYTENVWFSVGVKNYLNLIQNSTTFKHKLESTHLKLELL